MAQRALGQFDTVNVIKQDTGVELLSMSFHALHQCRAGQAFHIPRSGNRQAGGAGGLHLIQEQVVDLWQRRLHRGAKGGTIV